MASVGWLGPQVRHGGVRRVASHTNRDCMARLEHERLDLLSCKSEPVHSFRRSPGNVTCLRPVTPQALRLALPTELEPGSEGAGGKRRKQSLCRAPTEGACITVAHSHLPEDALGGDGEHLAGLPRGSEGMCVHECEYM